MSIEKVVYRAKAKATGGRDGRATILGWRIRCKIGCP